MTCFNSGDVFIVTGASGGIGSTVSKLISQNGGTVVGIVRKKEHEGLSSPSSLGPNFFLEQFDFSKDTPQFESFLKILKDKYGKVRGVVGCAGTGFVKPVRLENYDSALEQFNINFFSSFLLAKFFADKRNTVKEASGVFISSVSAYKCDKGHSVYSASKAALSSAIKCIGKEVALSGRRVNCISPSAIDTPMLRRNDAMTLAMQKELYPLGFGKPMDVAELALFLLSDRSKWISGQDYIVDCGSL